MFYRLTQRNCSWCKLQKFLTHQCSLFPFSDDFLFITLLCFRQLTQYYASCTMHIAYCKWKRKNMNMSIRLNKTKNQDVKNRCIHVWNGKKGGNKMVSLIEPVYFGCKWFYSLELPKTAEKMLRKETNMGREREMNETFHFSGELYMYKIGRSPTFVSFPFCWLLDSMTQVDFAWHSHRFKIE